MMNNTKSGASAGTGSQHGSRRAVLDKPYRMTALRAAALAAWIAAGLAPGAAQALGLGPIRVQSALGEPLDAAVEVLQIDADEAASLRVSLAPASAFRAAGVDYNAALAGAKVTLQQRPDGTRVLRIQGERAVNEPFLDLILEANWASGRLTREYTLLLDPPKNPAAKPADRGTTLPAVVSAPRPAAPVAVAPATATPRRTEESAAPGTGGTVTVRRGDTALGIVARHKPAGVSLEQMLVALLRANPDAFVGGNVNRLRAGAVVRLPDEASARGIEPGEARQVLALQSADFNAFRGRLARSVPAVQTEASSRAATGKVETQVTEQRPAAVAPDKLTLSKGKVASASDREAQIAAELRKKEAEQRLAELTRNANELAKLQTSSAALGAASAAASKPGLAVPATVPAASLVASATAQPASAAASTPAAAASIAASAAAAPASAVASAPASQAQAPASRPAVAKAAPAAPAPEPSLLDSLLENPLIPGAGAALIALLAGFGIYRMRANKANKAHEESSFLESRVQPDSFFGSSGGQHVDTSDEKPSGNSSLAYSPSQLEAGGDVDPVAEADVYLAYGRDLQAEEILKEALKLHPNRVAIHVKLAEIYAKRRDARAVEALAKQVLRITEGMGPEWQRLCEIGRSIDPNNPVYSGQAPESAPPTPESAPSPLFAPSTIPVNPKPEFSPSQSGVDFDLSQFDSPLPEEPSGGRGEPAASDTAATPAQADPAPAAEPAFAAAAETQAAAEPLANAPKGGDEALLEFDLGTLSLDLEPNAVAAATGAQAPTPASAASSMPPLSFDFEPSAAPTPAAPAPTEPASLGGDADELETKLALAHELRGIGDTEGARALAEEVLAAASGPLKLKAQQFRDDLG